MSYILDALKKSDQERQQGRAPGLQTIQMPLSGPGKKRAWWLYLIAAALLLNAGVFAWWLGPWRSGKQDTVSSRQAVAGPAASNAGKTAAGQPAKAAVAKATPAVAPKADSGTAKASSGTAAETVVNHSALQQQENDPTGTAQHRQQTSHPPAKQQEAATRSAVPAQSAKSGPAPVQAAAAKPAEPAPKKSPSPVKTAAANPQQTLPAASPKTVDAQPSVPVHVSGGKQLPPQLANMEQLKKILNQLPPPKHPDRMETLPVPGPSGAQSSGSTASATAPGSQPQGPGAPGVPNVYQLPGPVQRTIPELSLSFLVYSKTPQDRMVSINGKMMHEGQQVAPGLTLQKITPDGAVFSYHGHRFFKGVF